MTNYNVETEAETVKYHVEFMDKQGVRHDIKVEAEPEEDAVSYFKDEILELINVGKAK